MKRSYLLLTVVCFLFLSTLETRAQNLPVGPGLDVSVSTNTPIPGQEVTITVRSYSIDINSSTITWTVEGKTVQKGTGLTTYKVIAPSLGKKITVNITVVTASGQTITGSVSVSSGAIDLIIENNGYVPPFYKGKLPVTYQNTVTLIAMPHIADAKGVEYDPKTLTYQWKKNSRVIEDQSGYGKQSITLVGEIVPRPYTITVTATAKDATSQAVGFTTVDFGSPWLTFYKDDPLYGPLYNTAIGQSTYIGSQRETGVLAVPFGFNIKDQDLSNLALTWLINNYEYPSLATNRSVTLRAPDGQAGSSNIELRVQNNKDILQSAEKTFSATFSATASSSNSL